MVDNRSGRFLSPLRLVVSLVINGRNNPLNQPLTKWDDPPSIPKSLKFKYGDIMQAQQKGPAGTRKLLEVPRLKRLSG